MHKGIAVEGCNDMVQWVATKSYDNSLRTHSVPPRAGVPAGTRLIALTVIAHETLSVHVCSFSVPDAFPCGHSIKNIVSIN